MKYIGIILLTVIIFLAVRSVTLKIRDNHTSIDINNLNGDDAMLSCAVFDGKELWENATIVLEDGVVSDKSTFSHGESTNEYFLMPGLFDAHVHLTTPYQMEQLVKSGVTTVCDVSASEDLENQYPALKVWSSRNMIWKTTDNVKGFVAGVISSGGKYIKVVVDVPSMMGGGMTERSVLEEIVRYSHEKGLKVATHATTLDAYELAVDCGVDILIHIPMNEAFPEELAEKIADKGIYVMPTLVMMKAFSTSLIYGYKAEHYENARNAVTLLHTKGVPILVGTDANNSSFVPKVEHGSSLHTEMKLLAEAGIPTLDILQGATQLTAEAFEIDNAGSIKVNEEATMVLVKGRPDMDITDMDIVQIWVDGKPIMEESK